MGHILMDEMPTLWLDGNIDVLRRLLHNPFKILPRTFAMWWGIRRESDSMKIYGGEVNLCVPIF